MSVSLITFQLVKYYSFTKMFSVIMALWSQSRSLVAAEKAGVLVKNMEELYGSKFKSSVKLTNLH
jgi:hypothetical protein